MFGAGGGGGIDMGDGLLFQYSTGVQRKINNKWNWIANVGQLRPLEGNFTPLFVDLGIQLNINQLIKL